MCDTCGCGQLDEEVKIYKPGENASEHPSHPHHYHHTHSHHHEDGDHDHDHHHFFFHAHPAEAHPHDESQYPHFENQHEHHHDHHEHKHHHEHDHHHHDDKHKKHEHSHSKEIKLEMNILQKNDLTAERNRGYFEAKNIFAVNLVSSPGSGKTSLLERTIREIGSHTNIFVIEGDQQTSNDAERINATGVPVVQINTGNGCHLDAEMVKKAVKKLEIKDDSVLFIENVGNLVCPSMFDLGENARVVIISTTEGEDKPLKYPNMFHSSHLCIINKTDLLPYVDFDMAKVKENALRVNHHLEFIEVSVKTGEGMDKWIEWVDKRR